MDAALAFSKRPTLYMPTGESFFSSFLFLSFSQAQAEQAEAHQIIHALGSVPATRVSMILPYKNGTLT